MGIEEEKQIKKEALLLRTCNMHACLMALVGDFQWCANGSLNHAIHLHVQALHL